MADKTIQSLPAASLPLSGTELFVIEQSGAASNISADDLKNEYVALLNGHGGINDITYTPPVAPSLDGTLTITMADTTQYNVTIHNGNGIDAITVKYGISADGTDPTTVSSWSSSVVAPTSQYPFMWTRITIDDTTGNTTVAYSVTAKADDPSISVGSVSAVSGASPLVVITNSGTLSDPILDFLFTLPKGDKGDTGDYIVPVISYGTSTAAATLPSTWYNDPTSLSYDAGNFIWRKTEYTLQDAQTIQDTVTEIIGYIGLNGAGSGSVTQITFNGSVFADDGTGNVPMTIDAADVGAIEAPATPSNGQVLTYDSTAGKWVAANPVTGAVNTVNTKGVDAGTTNITLYASDIAMSSNDNTTIPNAMPQPATALPADLGTAAVGSSAKFAKEDHVHNMPPFGSAVLHSSGTYDFNDFKAAGIHWFSNSCTLSHNPTWFANGWLIVLPGGSANYCKQIAIKQGSNSGDFYSYGTRNYSPNSWSEWATGYTDKNMDSAIDAGLSGAAYTTTGLTPSNCTIGAGGYYRVGNLVIVNMRITTTAAVATGTSFVTGLPAPDTTLASNYMAFSVTVSDPTYAVIMLANGNIRNHSTSVSIPNGTNVGLSVTYIAKS